VTRENAVWQLDGVLLDALSSLGAPFERVEAGAYVVTLHGRRRPRTLVWLLAGEQAVAVEALSSTCCRTRRSRRSGCTGTS
jgi:hypothetical protein